MTTENEPDANMTDHDTSLPTLLTAQEVARQTGIPLSRVYQLSRRGDIPHVRLGRSLRYSAPELRFLSCRGHEVEEWVDVA